MPNLAQSPLVRAAIAATQPKPKQPPKLMAAMAPLTMSANLPFDAQGAAQRDDIVSGVNKANLDYQQAANDLITNSAVQTRNLQQQEPTNLRNLLNNFSGRGMAFSSGYGMARGQEQDRFANQLSQIAASRAQGLSGLATKRDESVLNAQQLLDRLIQSMAGRASNNTTQRALQSAASRSLYG